MWLYSKSENGKYVGGRVETVKLFGVIAAFILLIACILTEPLQRDSPLSPPSPQTKLGGAGKAM